MTIASERTRAVNYTRDFLRDLLDPNKTPRVPTYIRDQAHRLLRHYPWPMYLDQVGKCPKCSDIFSISDEKFYER